METKHEELAREVAVQGQTLARVELNQKHAEDMNKVQFGALDTGLKLVNSTLDAFIKRIDGIISGEIETAQTRQGTQMVADYMKWRGEISKAVDDIKDEQAIAKARTSGRVDILSWGKVGLLTLAPIAAVIVSIFVAVHK